MADTKIDPKQWNAPERTGGIAGALGEVGILALALEDRYPSDTRGDLFRRIRAAVELMPTLPPN